jgi:hypothetical protein
MTLVRPVTVCVTLRSVVSSSAATVPVVVYTVPGFSGNHLLSIVGDAGKSVLSKLNADPGPHSSGPYDVAVGDPDVDAGDGVPVEVGCVCPGFGAAHDATVEIARSSPKAELRADSRLFG